MPGSDPDSIEPVLRLVWALDPKSVLDVGAGSGKFGALFRDYLEAKHADVNSYRANQKLARIDAVEGFPVYIGDIHRVVYDSVYPMLIQEFVAVHKALEYDLIYAGDVVEHLEKREAIESVIPSLLTMSKLGVLIAVPEKTEPQGAVYGNELERHRSQWSRSDFRAIAPYTHVGRKGGKLLAFLSKYPEPVAKLRHGWLYRVRNVIRAMGDDW